MRAAARHELAGCRRGGAPGGGSVGGGGMVGEDGDLTLFTITLELLAAARADSAEQRAPPLDESFAEISDERGSIARASGVSSVTNFSFSSSGGALPLVHRTHRFGWSPLSFVRR